MFANHIDTSEIDELEEITIDPHTRTVIKKVTQKRNVKIGLNAGSKFPLPTLGEQSFYIGDDISNKVGFSSPDTSINIVSVSQTVEVIGGHKIIRKNSFRLNVKM